MDTVVGDNRDFLKEASQLWMQLDALALNEDKTEYNAVISKMKQNVFHSINNRWKIPQSDWWKR